VEVVDPNTAPVANNDSYTVNEGGTLNVAAPGVLGNDNDADNNSLTATLVGTGPSHDSSFTFNSDGSFVYTHDGSETTSDSFTYKANDGTVDSNTVTVTITIVPVDDPPTAVDDSATVQEDDSATAIDVLANDTDIDNGPRTIESVTQPDNGTVAITGAGSGLTYEPDADYCNDGSPTDNFSYTLNGGDTGDVAVTVTCVNDDPVISQVSNSGPVNEGSPATITVTASDVDNASSALRYSFDCNGDGDYTDAGDKGPNAANNDTCTFNDNDTYTVNVRVTDGAGGQATDSTQVTVNNVDPVVDAAANQSGAEEGSSFNFNLGSFTDPGDDDPWEVTVDWGDSSTDTTFTAATAGSLPQKSHTYADNGNYTVTVTVAEAGGSPSDSDTFQASVANVDPVVGTLSITDSNNGVACLGGNTVSLGFSFTDAGSADTHKATIAWGDGSTNTVVDPATSPVSGKQHTYSGLGPYTITVTVTDDDSGSDTETKSQSFHYNLGTTLLSPVNADNSSIFKLGSTIPLKINITDCSGAGVTGLSPDIRMIKTSSSAPLTGVDEGISTQPNDANWVMRDSGNGLYIYNLASKSLPDSTATYKAVITHNGYSVTSTNYFGLKTK
jgi:VCBS repeat-containing protein